MLAPLKRVVLRLAKVPAEPHAPAGSPGSIKVFRAAENYWKYLLLRWGIKQAAGAFAIVFFASMSHVWIEGLAASPLVRKEKAAALEPAPAPAPESRAKRARRGKRLPFTERQVRNVAWWVATIETIGIVTYIVQAPFSLAKARLEYEMRWYIVTDRSLRIREGILGVREMTLTFANVQNISVHQGPLQRLLGISDVVVRTAGGGSSGEDSHGGKSAGSSMHEGRLRAVDDAEAVRDLVLDRLRRFRDSGLGDPDDHKHAPAAPVATDASTLEAATALRDAARALTAALR
ncbi:MAG TPA: PH domain-containing protein [Candidatus Bathyarchaeia archaeon]|nr:PH domain-containing protein [Candidatus Bathyarchaeia archaeon]